MGYILLPTSELLRPSCTLRLDTKQYNKRSAVECNEKEVRQGLAWPGLAYRRLYQALVLGSWLSKPSGYYTCSYLGLIHVASMAPTVEGGVISWLRSTTRRIKNAELDIGCLVAHARLNFSVLQILLQSWDASGVGRGRAEDRAEPVAQLTLMSQMTGIITIAMGEI